MHAPGIEVAGSGLFVEVAQQIGGDPRACRIAVQRKNVAAISNLDIEPLLDLVEMLVELTAKLREPLCITRFERDRVCCRRNVQLAVLALFFTDMGLSIAALAKNGNTAFVGL